jgi:mannose-6-phosphate isomerase-like protein (cupin superfamily)
MASPARVGAPATLGCAAGVPDDWHEVLDLADVLARTGVPITLGRHRADFHAVFAVTEGRSVHQIDFAPVELAAGTVTWVRPGAVQQFSMPDEPPRGYLVLFTDATPAEGPEVRQLLRPSSRLQTATLPQPSMQILDRLVAELMVDTLPAARRHLLSALLLHLGGLWSAPAGPDAGHAEVVRAFEELMENSLGERLTARDAARQLGWSARTSPAPAWPPPAGPRRTSSISGSCSRPGGCWHGPAPTAGQSGAGWGFRDASAFGAFSAARPGRPRVPSGTGSPRSGPRADCR